MIVSQIHALSQEKNNKTTEIHKSISIHLPIIELFPITGGVPTVERAGPWLPALHTQVIPYLFTTSFANSPTLLTCQEKHE